MLSLTVQTKRNEAEVAERLTSFFGPGGLGLTMETDDDCYSFTGAGGHVTARVSQQDGETCIDLETQEFENDVRRFAREGL